MVGFCDLQAGNNARDKVLPSAIAYRAHFPNQFDGVFTCWFLCHVLKALIFYRNKPKIKLLLQKNCLFPSGWGHSPPISEYGYVPG